MRQPRNATDVLLFTGLSFGLPICAKFLVYGFWSAETRDLVGEGPLLEVLLTYGIPVVLGLWARASGKGQVSLALGVLSGNFLLGSMFLPDVLEFSVAVTGLMWAEVITLFFMFAVAPPFFALIGFFTATLLIRGIEVVRRRLGTR